MTQSRVQELNNWPVTASHLMNIAAAALPMPCRSPRCSRRAGPTTASHHLQCEGSHRDACVAPCICSNDMMDPYKH